ncbi:MAG: hypothetical protein ABIJ09_19735 [Pseudomonadota bacterium]
MPLLCSMILTLAGALMVLTGIPAVASSVTFIYSSLGGLLESQLAGQPQDMVQTFERWGVWIGMFGLAFNGLQVSVGVGLIWRRAWARQVAVVVTGLWFLAWLLAGIFFFPLLLGLGIPALLLLALLHPDGAEQFYAQPVPGVPGAWSEKIVPNTMWVIVGILVVGTSAVSIYGARVTIPLAAESLAEGFDRARQRAAEKRSGVREAGDGAEGAQDPSAPVLRRGGFFTFTDDKGVTHAVDSWDKIPQRHRGKAQRVE